MTGTPDPPKPLGESLERVIASLGGPSVHGLRTLFDRWNEIVGEQLAAHARPQGIEDGVLVILVDEPGWATQLTFLQADLVRRLGEVLGEGVVQQVVVRVPGAAQRRRSRGVGGPGW